MAKTARTMKVVKIGEVTLTKYDARIGYNDLNEMLRFEFPNMRNIEEDIRFNGKVTIIIEEFLDEQSVNTFELPEPKEEVNE